MSLTIVTTTRDRPLCFSLLETWVRRQTVQPQQWLVINDGSSAYQYTCGQQVVQRDASQDTLPSICGNWLAALPLIRGDVVVVAEDDDWLHPDFCGALLAQLKMDDLAGIGHDLYYRVPTRRYTQMHNTGHASLGATAFRRVMLERMERCCSLFRSVWLDMYLWAEGTAFNRWSLRYNRSMDGRALHVGLKCMPGAAGLGLGHDPEEGTPDPEGKALGKWVGEEDARMILTAGEPAR